MILDQVKTIYVIYVHTSDLLMSYYVKSVCLKMIERWLPGDS